MVQLTNVLWSRPLARFAAFAACVSSFCGAAATGPGGKAGDDVIRFGMSTALTGTAAGLGANMRAGVEAAFADANKAGGVKGRRVELVVLDDGYEPSRTAPNMKQLIETQGVVGIIGNVGTPTAVVAIPIAQASGTAFFGAFTGAALLRKSPPDKCVINYRASYNDETAAMVNALIDHAGLKPGEVGFFTQRDAYGDAGYNGGMAALKARGLPGDAKPPHGRYERNTDAVEDAVAELLSASPAPRAVIMVGTAPPTAKFVRLARETGLNAAFLSVSFVGANELARLLGKDGDGVVVTEVVPHVDAELPIIRDFRAAAAPEYHKQFTALEGYIAGRIMLKALGGINAAPGRSDIIGALESLGRFDLGLDEPLELSPTKHQACSRVWATRLSGGAVAPLEWKDLGRGPGVAEVPEGR